MSITKAKLPLEHFSETRTRFARHVYREISERERERETNENEKYKKRVIDRDSSRRSTKNVALAVIFRKYYSSSPSTLKA